MRRITWVFLLLGISAAAGAAATVAATAEPAVQGGARPAAARPAPEPARAHAPIPETRAATATSSAGLRTAHHSAALARPAAAQAAMHLPQDAAATPVKHEAGPALADRGEPAAQAPVLTESGSGDSPLGKSLLVTALVMLAIALKRGSR